jgi:hypothetical protein
MYLLHTRLRLYHCTTPSHINPEIFKLEYLLFVLKGKKISKRSFNVFVKPMISCLFFSSLIMNIKIPLQRNFSGVTHRTAHLAGGVELDGPNLRHNGTITALDRRPCFSLKS